MWNWRQYLPPSREGPRQVPPNTRVHPPLVYSGPRQVTSAEGKTSQGDSLNFIKSWNKKNLIKETPEVTSQNSNLGRLHMFAEVPQISSDNRSTWVQNFPTHQAKFFNLVPFDSMQTASSKCKNSDYSLDVSLLLKSSIRINNPDCHSINQKASLLAASSLAYFKF